MRLVLNEVKEAERQIESNILDSKPSETLCLLSRYYRQIKELTPKETKEKLFALLKLRVNNYSADDWTELVDKIVSNAKKRPLLQIDFLTVTRSEMEYISQIKKKSLQKLAFTLLVLAKYGNAKNDNNNNWVLTQQYKVFKLARVEGKSKWTGLKELRDIGLISFAQKVDNVNVQVNFIDDDSEVVMKITDLRELGYQYLRYTGEEFVECQECGILVRKTFNNKKYCKDCAGYKPIITKTIICCDCGEPFEVDSRNTKTVRCEFCQSVKNKDDIRKRVNKLRNIGNCNATN